MKRSTDATWDDISDAFGYALWRDEKPRRGLESRLIEEYLGLWYDSRVHSDYLLYFQRGASAIRRGLGLLKEWVVVQRSSGALALRARPAPLKGRIDVTSMWTEDV